MMIFMDGMFRMEIVQKKTFQNSPLIMDDEHNQCSWMESFFFWLTFDDLRLELPEKNINTW
jgi:hypothetical protein